MNIIIMEIIVLVVNDLGLVYIWILGFIVKILRGKIGYEERSRGYEKFKLGIDFF